MPRTIRIQLIAIIASVVLSLGTIALWIRSYQRYEVFEAVLSARHLLRVSSPKGTIEMSSVEGVDVTDLETRWSEDQPRAPGVERHFLGFGFAHGRFPLTG